MADEPGEAKTVQLGRAESAAHAHTVSVTGADDRPIVDDALPSAFDGGAGRFETRGELGRGGMGRVLDVYDRALARQVAIKHVLSSDPVALARFQREARITARLEHPGIVPVYETGRNSDGTPFYVMRRVDGKPVNEAVVGKSLAERLALVPNVLAACDALAYAHARGIIHRDIKPSNILLGPFGETLVIDWGLARTLDDGEDGETASSDGAGLTRAGAVAGTPGYMAPEQARGEPLDASADVFALGATLFYVLAEVAPHTADRGTQVVARVAGQWPVEWSRMPAGVPDDLRTILDKALAGDRVKRYPDAGALAADLRRFVTGNLVAAHRYSSIEQLRRFVRRHRAAVAIALASIVVIAVVATVAVRRVIRERDAATAARERETDRANALAIAQARALVETNPTLAVATVRPLALRHWRDVYDITAAARARGVAWRLAPGASRHLSMAPDGRYAARVGVDGRVEVFDVPARTARTVAELGPIGDRDVRCVIASATQHAIFDGTKLVVHDAMQDRTLAIASPAVAIAARGHSFVWIDKAGHAWRLDPADAAPVAFAIDDELGAFDIARDDNRIVFAGKAAVWTAELHGGTPQRLTDERFLKAVWDTGGKLVIATTVTKGTLLGIDTTTTPPTVQTVAAAGIWPDQLAAIDGTFYIQTAESLMTSRGTTRYSNARGAGLVIARDDIVVSAISDGKVTLQRGERTHAFVAPSPIEALAAVPAGSYLVAATRDGVVSWNLDDVFPRHLPLSFGVELVGGPHHLLSLARGSPNTWIDLASFARTPGPTQFFESGPPLVAVHRDSERIVVLRDGIARVFRINTADNVELARDVTFARFLDANRIVMVKGGALVLHDFTKPGDRELVKPPTEIKRLFGEGDMLAIVLADGNCIRMNLKSGATAEITGVPIEIATYLAPDGTMFFASDRVLRVWRPDGTVGDHATLPVPILVLFAVDAEHVIVDTSERGYIIDLAHPSSMLPISRLGTKMLGPRLPHIVASSSGAFVAIPGELGGAQLLDGTTGAVWPIGQAGGERVSAQLSVDGTVLYERRKDGLWTLPVEPPVDAATTAAAIDRLTNWR